MMKYCKLHLLAICLLGLFSLNPQTGNCQVVSDSAVTAGLKYTVLEVAMGKGMGWCPDADQDVIEKVQPLYPRALMVYWHGVGDPMLITGDPFSSTGYTFGYPQGTIDRAVFSSAVVQSRPWESYVGTRNALAPKFNVKVVCDYNAITRLLTVKVTGTSLMALTGDWRINAYVLEDSISSGLSSSYNQSNFLNAAGSMACTGSLSYYIGAGNPITSGALYSHMHVARAILCAGASIWGEAAFSNPASGTTVTKTYTYTIPSTYVASRMKVIGLVAKYGATTSDRAVENAIKVNVPAVPVLFSGGHTQTMAVCQNSTANSINALTAVYDENVGHTVNWTLISGPSHGSASATYSTTSTGAVLTPTGLSYTPTAGYTGTDTFKVRVADGSSVDTTMICVTVNPLPGAITGTLSICTSASTTLTSTTAGGTWASSTTGVATIGSTSGIANGITAGTSTISYTLSTGCRTTAVLTVSAAPSAGTISGASSVCAGASTTLATSGSGGTWSSSATGTATIGSSSGIVSALAGGTTTISYTVVAACSTAVATFVFTVNPLPAAISGSLYICTSATSTLSSTPAGGTWASSTTGVATIGSSSGIANGISAGTSTITYTLPTGCKTTSVVTVSSTPSAGTISGLSNVCAGSTITLSSTVVGGTWTSSATSVATVGSSSGVVTGVASGVAVISYTVSSSCGPATAIFSITVNPLPVSGTITGASGICVGATTTLTSSGSGGTWSSSATGVATIGSTTGMVSGVATGTSTISYSVTNSCGTATATYVVTVAITPTVAAITGVTAVCEGGATITLASSTAGGVWSSSITTVATVGSTDGIVTGVATGTTIITYTITNACGTATTIVTVTVDPLPNAGSIIGPATVCEAETITLTDAVGGGTWSSSNANATVSATGVVTGVTAGFSTISYTVTNGCGSASATAPVIVLPIALCPTLLPSVRAANDITIYPNPATDDLHIAYSATTELSYAIRNVIGKALLQGTLNNGENTISLHSLPAGIYLVELTAANGEKVVRKVVKE